MVFGMERDCEGSLEGIGGKNVWVKFGWREKRWVIMGVVLKDL